MICEICHSTITSDQEVVICPSDHSPHHKDCWNFYGGCGNLGCRHNPHTNGYTQASPAVVVQGKMQKTDNTGATRYSYNYFLIAGIILLVGVACFIVGGTVVAGYLGGGKTTTPSDTIEPPFNPTSITSITEFPTDILPTQTQLPLEPTSTVVSNPANNRGKIVYTCQVFKDNNRNQICIMNADGSGQKRLTNNDQSNNWYASLSPDGNNIVFSSNQTGSHEIYEMDLEGNQFQLTHMGELYAPEISPNGQYIVFTNAGNTYSSIWIMNRDGSSPHEIYATSGRDALDPTWSPDGKKILFALGVDEKKSLYTINLDGTSLDKLNDNITTRGRSDWSPDGKKLAGYSGGPWKRKVFLLNSDGSGLVELYSSGNVQAPSFSPDSLWLAFTGYIDNMGNEDGCEIYIIKIDGSGLKRLTKNTYCDWQPRWGP